MEELRVRLGYTLVETLLVTAVYILLAGFAVVNFLTLQHRTTLTSVVDTFLSDAASQKIRAASGDGGGSSFGVYIGGDRYVLFQGDVYDNTKANNEGYPLPKVITLITSFPSSQLVFTKGSGDITGFVQGSDTITFTHSGTGEVKEIQLNSLGVITKY